MRKIILGAGELALCLAVIYLSAVVPASAGIVGAAGPGGIGISHVVAFVVGVVVGAIVIYFVRRNR